MNSSILKHIAFSICMFIGTSVKAQNKLLTIEDAVLKGKTGILAPKKLEQLKWIENTNLYYYIDNKNLWIGTAHKEKPKSILSLNLVNKQLLSLRFDTLKNFPLIEWQNQQVFSFTEFDKLFEYNLDQNKLNISAKKALPADAENADKCKKNSLTAFTRKNNLYLFDGANETAVTNYTEAFIVNGQAVHRNEFGINKGTFWSDEGNYLAYYRMDEGMVTDYPIVDWNEKHAKNKDIKYPFAGDKSHTVKVGVYDVKNKSTIYLETGEPAEQYLTNIAWSPDEKSIYIAVLNRAQNHLKLNQYNAQNGKFVKTLFEEKDEKYVQPLTPLQFVRNNPTQFVWQSQRDGYNHMYLYDTNGNQIKQLTKGNWEVASFFTFNIDGSEVLYLSNQEGAINQDFYSVNIKTTQVKRLTSGSGNHNVWVNSKNGHFIDYYTSSTIPKNYSIVNINTGKTELFYSAENPLKDYKLGELSLFTIKNNQGTDLQCRMFKPVDFDDNKKYPVLVYLYGGPGVQIITNTWLGGADLWYQYMAQKGFVVFSLDNRGSKNKGRDFEQATFRNLGTAEMEDQLCGVRYLKSLSFIDTNRMGVHGWSFGGFMTTSLMTRNPGIFKVAVAGGPVIDWRDYEIMYTERYMDTPQENPEGYEKSCLLNYVDKLQGKLMLIHGTNDDVVVWQHSLKYLKTAVDKGIQLDYFAYPGHLHNVLGKDRAHLMKKITNYFIDNL